MSGRIAYVSSRFPVLREAFIIREVLALEREGIDVRVFSLKRPHRDLVNRDLDAIAGSAYWTPHFLCWALIRDNILTFLGAPWRYVSTPLRNAFRFRRHPLQALKVLGLFPKMVHYSREIRRQGCQGINSCWANFPTLMATVAERFFGIPYCMTCRAWDIFVPMNQIDLADKIATARVVRTNNDAGSAFVRRFCANAADERKIRRVYNPIDVRGIACRDEVPGGPPTLVAGGSLVEQKGLEYLLDALALLRSRGLVCRLRIVGEGPLREDLEALARRHGLDDTVEFCGTVPNHDLLAMMTASTAFVLPSVPATSGQMDGIPNVLIESMALSVPVISTSISGIPELVQDGESGLLVPPRDSKRLAEAIEKLVNDRELQREFGIRGRRRVESMFEMSANARELIEVYESAGLLSHP